MKIFKLNNIKNNMFLGDIRLVENINENLLAELQECKDMLGDYSCVCTTIPIKYNAILVRVSDEYFVNFDNIKNLKDLKRINVLLNYYLEGDNTLMTYGASKPFIGKLYISNIRPCDESLKLLGDIRILKLKNTQK